MTFIVLRLRRWGRECRLDLARACVRTNQVKVVKGEKAQAAVRFGGGGASRRDHAHRPITHMRNWLRVKSVYHHT